MWALNTITFTPNDEEKSGIFRSLLECQLYKETGTNMFSFPNFGRGFE